MCIWVRHKCLVRLLTSDCSSTGILKGVGAVYSAGKVLIGCAQCAQRRTAAKITRNDSFLHSSHSLFLLFTRIHSTSNRTLYTHPTFFSVSPSVGAVRASSIFPILSVILLFMGGLCIAASEFYKSRHNIILSAGILFVSAGETMEWMKEEYLTNIYWSLYVTDGSFCVNQTNFRNFP